MKRVLLILKRLMIGLALLAFLILALGFLYFKTFIFVNYDEKNVVNEVPLGEKSVVFYLRDGGSLSHDSILGVYKEGEKKKKVIFLYPTYNVSAHWQQDGRLAFSWIDAYTNEKKAAVIDVEKEVYDWRDEN